MMTTRIRVSAFVRGASGVEKISFETDAIRLIPTLQQTTFQEPLCDTLCLGADVVSVLIEPIASFVSDRALIDALHSHPEAQGIVNVTSDPS